jgi:hypothetical protein
MHRRLSGVLRLPAPHLLGGCSAAELHSAARTGVVLVAAELSRADGEQIQVGGGCFGVAELGVARGQLEHLTTWVPRSRPTGRGGRLAGDPADPGGHGQLAVGANPDDD